MATKKPRERRRSSILPKDGPNQVGNFSTRFSLPSFVKRVDKLTEAQKEAISKMGFGNLLSIPNHMLSKNLLVELMDRWNPEKRAFMLVTGEVTITLLDVALILGLCVSGDPAILREDATFLELEKEYGAALWNRKITVASLEERLEALGEICDVDFVRTFLLFVFGTILFPNTNGKVDSRYLSLLHDLDKIPHFAWGVAVLEDLYHWLSKRKEINVQYVGGCLILLQIWSYEHIDIARPSLRNDSLKFPRACRWENSKSHQRPWFTARFKELEPNQMFWKLELTSEESESEIIKDLPEAVRERTNIHLELRSPANYSSATEHIVSISHEIREQQDFEWFERRMNIIGEVQKDHSNQLSSSLSPAVVSTGHRHLSLASCGARKKEKPKEHPQVQSNNSIVIISDEDNEDASVLEHGVLEEENTKLRIENNDLRDEIELLKNKLSVTTKLEQQNAKLRIEVETLRQQNQYLTLSAYGLVARLESLVFDGNGNDTEESYTVNSQETDTSAH